MMLRYLTRLFRLPLAAMNGVAAVGGYLMFTSKPGLLSAAAVALGVSLMAAAGSALNQVIERDRDALMRRTRNRPLPRAFLSPQTAGLLGGCCFLAGASLLAAYGGGAALLLAMAALAWYLAVYTPLKRVTPLALLAGAICGCAAPLIGWSAAGGGFSDYRIVLLAGILYLWQVPHFWMLQRKHEEDYRAAGFRLFSPGGAAGLLPFQMLWISAMIAGAMMLPTFGIITRNAPLWCFVFATPLLLAPIRRFEPALSAGVNLFPAVVTFALYLGR